MSKPLVAPFTADELSGPAKKRRADEDEAGSAEDPADDSDADESESDDEGSGDAESDQDEDDASSSESDDDDEPVIIEPKKAAPKKGDPTSAPKAKGAAADKDGRKVIRGKTLTEATVARNYTILHDPKATAKQLEQQQKLCVHCTNFSDMVAKGLELERDCRIIKNAETGAIIYVTSLYTKKECERMKKASMGWRELTPNMLNAMAAVKAWVKTNMAALKGERDAELTPLVGSFSAPTTLIEINRGRVARVAPARATPSKADGTGRKRSQPRAATDVAVAPLSEAPMLALPPLEPTSVKTLARIMLDRQPATTDPADGKQFFKRMTASSIVNDWDKDKLLKICGATEVLEGVMDTVAPSFSEQHQRLMTVCAKGAAQAGFTMQYCLAAGKEIALETFALGVEQIDALANENQLLHAHVAALRQVERTGAEQVAVLTKELERSEAGAKATIDELSGENASLTAKCDKLAEELKEQSAMVEKMIAESEMRIASAAKAALKAESSVPAAAAAPSKQAPAPTPGSDKIGWTSSKTGHTTEPATKTSNGAKKVAGKAPRHATGGKSPRSGIPVATPEAPAPDAPLPASLFD